MPLCKKGCDLGSLSILNFLDMNVCVACLGEVSAHHQSWAGSAAACARRNRSPAASLLESWDMIFLAPAGRNSPFSRDTGRSGRKTNPTQNAVRQLQRVSLSSANVSIARRLVFCRQESSWPVKVSFPTKNHCLLWRERQPCPC